MLVSVHLDPALVASGWDRFLQWLQTSVRCYPSLVAPMCGDSNFVSAFAGLAIASAVRDGRTRERTEYVFDQRFPNISEAFQPLHTTRRKVAGGTPQFFSRLGSWYTSMDEYQVRGVLLSLA